MFLIALTGGEITDREQIADRLVSAGKARLAGYALNPPMRRGVKPLARKLPPLNGEARAATLAQVIDGLECKPAAAGGLVIIHCLTLQEAALVRENGGEIWHVYGSAPSALVPIRRADRMITPRGPGFGHVLDPLEALSEYLLAMGQAARSSKVRVSA
ncbi:hypothetical protein LIS66_27150 (plasmid) [Pseudomonas sp. HN2]|uniref:hypothetical protein n=1 Tax=Pseudomonas sp. HN2 TaxID=2884805 RepID=UPI001D13BE9C|nr:hypothetical protein [Pseudomonas sp. HN2]UEB98653.1 hypothetical protein LIS66_27445 [Pseudomonas sp. HN2]UEB98709.1 hypothetical protein LIS66_27150 [Pseudomonas sp. HN2]